MFVLYGLNASQAIMPFDNPGIISIPLSFLTLIISIASDSEKDRGTKRILRND